MYNTRECTAYYDNILVDSLHRINLGHELTPRCGRLDKATEVNTDAYAVERFVCFNPAGR